MFKRKHFLDQSGFAHHFLLAALVIMIGVASFGTYKLVVSHADTSNILSVTTAKGCDLAGRSYNSSTSTCAMSCKGGQGSFNTDGRYCNGYIAATVTQDACLNTYHRYYIAGIGCAKITGATSVANAPQCLPGYPNYTVGPNSSTCTATTSAATTTQTATSSTSTTSSTPKSTGSTSSSTSSTTTTTGFDNLSEMPCARLGREFMAGSGCKTSCSKVAGTYALDSNKNGYCKNAFSAASQISQTKCAALHRVWISSVPGCTRKADNVTAAGNTVQCQPGFPRYIAAVGGKNFAYCAAATGATSIPRDATDTVSGGGGNSTASPFKHKASISSPIITTHGGTGSFVGCPDGAKLKNGECVNKKHKPVKPLPFDELNTSASFCKSIGQKRVKATGTNGFTCDGVCAPNKHLTAKKTDHGFATCVRRNDCTMTMGLLKSCKVPKTAAQVKKENCKMTDNLLAGCSKKTTSGSANAAEHSQQAQPKKAKKDKKSGACKLSLGIIGCKKSSTTSKPKTHRSGACKLTLGIVGCKKNAPQHKATPTASAGAAEHDQQAKQTAAQKCAKKIGFHWDGNKCVVTAH